MKLPLMKIVVFCIVSNLLISCSSPQRKKETRKDVDAEKELDVPSWVFNPEKKCKSYELCVSSSAESEKAADLRAQKSMASIFELKVKSSFELYRAGSTAPIDNSREGIKESIDEIEEVVSSNVLESVDEILKAAKVRSRFVKNGIYFTLLTLNKNLAAKSLKLHMDKLKEHLNYLLKLKQKSSIKKMLTIYEEHRRLNERYIILTENKLPLDVNYIDIVSIRYATGKKNKVYLKYNEETPFVLVAHLKEILASSGLNPSEKSMADYTIMIVFRSSKEYLNVDGFEKYSFKLEAVSLDTSKKQLGSFVISEVSTGRNEQDAFLKVKKVLIKKIEDELDLLSLK